jgi:glyoxylase-like metal-dependent hydrolase (beta-lactamase superfamily II)
VWRHRDRANVYVIERNGRALLIDSGDGTITDRIDATAVDWVLHTHHHRDSAGGAVALAEYGASIAAPAAEADIFEDAEGFWQRLALDDRYDCANAFSVPATSVPIAQRLADYERFRWQDLEFEVLPTPGHTRGSVTYLVTINGVRIAFCGDLIHSPGRVPTIYDLHWEYSNPDGVNSALHSASVLRGRGTDLLAPAHGDPIGDPAAALSLLETNLHRLHAIAGAGFLGDADIPPASELRVTRVSEHLLSVTQTNAHFHVLLGPEGRTLLFDYGFATADHVLGARHRFVEHSLAELERVAGVRTIDVIVPTHYHDDHVAGIGHLHDRLGCEVWAYAGFADVLRRPHAYRLPAVWRNPVPVTRTYALGETIEWEGWRFTPRECPGHTRYAVALYGVVDGRSVGVTGDEIQLDGEGRLRGGGPVYRNGFRAGCFLRGLEGVAEFRPEVVLTGHDGAIELADGSLEELRAWARSVDEAHAALAPIPAAVDLALDTEPVRADPYRAAGRCGEPVEIEVEVANHYDRAMSATVVARAPAGWSVEPDRLELELPPSGLARRRVTVTPPAAAPVGVRHVVTFDADLGGVQLGWGTEALVTLAP